MNDKTQVRLLTLILIATIANLAATIFGNFKTYQMAQNAFYRADEVGSTADAILNEVE